MSHLPISENSKTVLRKNAAELRDSLPMRDISHQIQEQLLSWPVFQKAEIVLFYSAFKSEVDLFPLVSASKGKQWYLPKVEKSELEFFRYTNQTPLTLGSYGILEPFCQDRFDPSCGPAPFLILVPGLMFDRKGYRLGYGKGYYDRFLKKISLKNAEYISIGMLPKELCTEQLPIEPHDIPVNWLFTEFGPMAIEAS